MTTKVSMARRWTEPAPEGVPKAQWPRRRAHVWMVRWFETTGRRSRQFDGKAEAEGFAASMQAQLDADPALRTPPRTVTLDAFRQEIKVARVGPRGQAVRSKSVQGADLALRRLIACVGDLPLAEVTKSVVARWSASLRAGLTVSTANKDRRTVRAAFSTAVALGYIRVNPFSGIRQDKATAPAIRYVTPDEYAALLGACKDQRWRVFVMLGYAAGLRRNEAFTLTWGDVDCETNEVSVRAKRQTEQTFAWDPKDSEARSIPVPAEIIQALADLQLQASGPYVLLDPGRVAVLLAKGRSWLELGRLRNNVGVRWDQIVARAEATCPSVQGITYHDLRRSAITNWSRAANMATVMRLAGHSSIETTQRYYAAVTDDQRELARRAIESVMPMVQTDAQTDALSSLPEVRTSHGVSCDSLGWPRR